MTEPTKPNENEEQRSAPEQTPPMQPIVDMGAVTTRTARGTTITIVSLLNLTAMAGVAGAGGLGDFAIRYGHDRNMADITNVTVLVLVLIVCVIEFAGGRIVKKNTH